MAGDESVFEQMAAHLSEAEREQILERIRLSSKSGEEPLYVEPEDDTIELEIIYERLSFFQKLALFIRSLFTQKDPIEVLEDSSMDRLAKEAASQSPGLFNGKTKCFEAAFAFELRELKERTAVLADQLVSAGNDRKEFLAFLAGIEFPSLQSQLLNASTPEYYPQNSEGTNWHEVKRQMQADVRQHMEGLNEDDREVMYQHTRSLKLLSDLVFFPFAKILSFFESSDASVAVSLMSVRESFLELGDILASMATPPKGTLLKALVLFHSKDTNDDAALQKLYQLNANGVAQIRTFNHRVPMMKLLKIAKRDIGYRPSTRSGGEDWFAVLKSFWEERITHAIDKASYEDNKNGILQEFSKLVPRPPPPVFERYRDDVLKVGSYCKFEASAFITVVILEQVFKKELAKRQKHFLVEGDFYKPQNREELTNSLNFLERAPSDFHAVDMEIDTDHIPEHIERKIEKLINDTLKNISVLINVGKGILYGESGGRYDTLANISSIGGSENQVVLDRLTKDLAKLERITGLILSMYELERSAKHSPSPMFKKPDTSDSE